MWHHSLSVCIWSFFFFLPLIHLLTQLQLFPLRKWFSNMCLRHTFRLSYLTVLPSFKTKKKKNWSNTKFLICPSSHSCSTQDYLYLTCVCVCSRIFFSVYSGLKFWSYLWLFCFLYPIATTASAFFLII